LREFNVGILQFGATKDKEVNIRRISNLLRIDRADIVVFPEYSIFDITGLKPEEVYTLAEDLNGPYVGFLKKLASEYNTYILGTLVERSDKPPKTYNTTVLVSPDGELIYTYRKTHLFDAYNYRESEVLLPGNELSKVVNVKGVRVGVAVCFELRFPEVIRTLALEGAEVIFIPAAWYSGSLKEETLLTLAKARAIENTLYVVIAAQYSQHFSGRSSVVDPLGVVVTDLGIGEKYREVTIDLDVIDEVRKLIPTLKLRRPELYRTS
jgi:predicted amidohydrolase